MNRKFYIYSKVLLPIAAAVIFFAGIFSLAIPLRADEGGSITVCTIILNEEGKIALSGEGLPETTFKIQITQDSIGTTPLETAVFTASNYSVNRNTVNGGNLDASCMKFSGLRINDFYYRKELISVANSDLWKEPRYNDQFITHVNSTDDFFSYGAAHDGDATIVLKGDRPHRTLIVLNQLKAGQAGPNRRPPLEASCDASPTHPKVGERVTWTSYPRDGAGNYIFNWSGTDGLSGENETVQKTYTSQGTKQATVVITSAYQTVTRRCSVVVDPLPMPLPARLKVTKTVINDNGGTKNVSDFPLFVAPAQTPTNRISIASGQEQTFLAGSYVVTEENQSGYTAGAWGGDCNSTGQVTLVAGTTKHCTITNNDNPPTPLPIPSPQFSAFCSAHLSKVTISWQEASRGSQGYVIDLDNDNNFSNGYWIREVSASTQSITAPDGFTSFGGASGALTLSSGTTYYVRIFYRATGEHSPTATFTAVSCQQNPPNPQTGCIDVLKEVFDSTGTRLGTVPQFTFRLNSNTQAFNDSQGHARFINVSLGTHTVTEIVPTGWSQILVTPSQGTVTVVPGSQCAGITFKNRQLPLVSPPNQNPALGGFCSVSTSFAYTGASVTFFGSGNGGTGSYSYSWSGTDGISGSTSSIVKTFSSAGTKTAAVRITSGAEFVDRQCSVVIADQPVYTPAVGVSCYALNPNPRVGETVNYVSQPFGGAGSYSYSWSGTEGISGSGSSLSHSYGSVGSKTATVVVTSGGQTASAQCFSFVQEVQQTFLNVSCYASPQNVQIGENVTYTASVSGGSGNYSYSWYADGYGGSSQNISRSYGSSGTKYATVTVTSGNQSIQRTCSLYVNEPYNNQYQYQNPQNQYQNLYASCNVYPSTILTGQSATWAVDVSGGTGNYSYYWTGDGLSGSSRTITQSYSTAGTKYGTVTVYSGNQTLTRTCTLNVNQAGGGASNVTVYRTPGETPLASAVYLSQVPYTGIGSTAKVAAYVLMLLVWSAFISYMVIRKKARRALDLS